MPPLPPAFRIPARVASRVVVSGLGERWTVVHEPVVTVRRTYLDTADWRAHCAGIVVEHDHRAEALPGEASTLSLRDIATGVVVACGTVAAPPRFAHDLPDSAPWERLRAAIEDRRLLDRVVSRTRCQRFRILNGDKKTTAWLLIDRHAVGGEDPRRVLTLASVLPVRGYERTAERIAVVLTQSGLLPESEPLTVLARSLLSESPPGPPPGPGVSLDRQMRATQAVSAVLRRLRDNLLASEPGVRNQLDREFLHEARVAIRRARSVIKQSREFLPPDEAVFVAEDLRWVGRVTGEARDIDVHLIELEECPDTELAPLRRYLGDRRRAVQRDLLEVMDSGRYQRLVGAWGDLSGDVNCGDSAGEAVDVLVRRAHRKVLRRGRAIHPSSPPEDLHDLRKDAKEFRYLLECFASLYPGPHRATVVKELKALQDNLGEFQDCQVQASSLRAMADDLLEMRTAPASTLMAMGRLADSLDARQRAARSEFDRGFSQFSSAPARRHFEELFEAGAGPAPARP